VQHSLLGYLEKVVEGNIYGLREAHVDFVRLSILLKRNSVPELRKSELWVYLWDLKAS
jgi:hypothetical protein